MQILVLEPYHGGSHKTFLAGLRDHVDHHFIMMTLPARKWKWRMRLAAPYFAEKIKALSAEKKIDAVFCSSFVDVAALRSLLPAEINRLPFHTYFHENQFAYPVRKEDERDLHFGLTNLTTVLASDRVGFNTNYNFQTFIEGVERILKICPDMKLAGLREEIVSKSTILYPGIDFSHIDRASKTRAKKAADQPVIVWNHRWEHDKNPKTFFRTLYALDEINIDFRLIILGQSFRRKPSIFSEAQKRLSHRILHCGYVESRHEYARLLCQGDIVVSSSRHEFYGISVIEAVRAGCLPVLPDRLSYPELFPEEYLFGRGGLSDRLIFLCKEQTWLNPTAAISLTEKFSWSVLGEKYGEWFCSSANNQGN